MPSTWQLNDRVAKIGMIHSISGFAKWKGNIRLAELSRNTGFTTEELIQFSQGHPWRPHYPVNLVKRFLGELISSREMIIDLFDSKGRAATGILIDTVSNPANDACLEIIGIRSDVNADAIVRELAQRCKELTPTSRSGFQMGVDTEAQETLLLALGLKHHYDIYEMLRPKLDGLQKSVVTQIEEGTWTDVDEIYSVLCEAFRNNPDTSIPDVKTWRENFLKNPNARYLVWREKGQILGFTHLIPLREDTAEINTIGVLSECRGRGVGAKLLNQALSSAFEMGYSKCHLMVATANKKALGLYRRAGFQVQSKQSTFRWSRS